MLLRLKRAAKGGALPHKKATAGLATETMPLPEKIVLMMQQHIGAPCKPVVGKGDKVEVGSLVGKAQGFVSADIHSGVSGLVTEVGQMVGFDGRMVETVVIQPDGLQTVAESVLPPAVRDRESFVEAVRACGLVGLGGAGFPTAVKLTPKNPEGIEILVINGAECEPYITSDTREMLECGDAVLSGIAAVKKYLNISKVVIGIERNKPEAMDLMFSLTKGDDSLSVLPLKTLYPQGAEKVLIEAATGREVPDGGLPADVGVLVMNVATVSAIGKYLATGMPLVTRRITVDGGAVKEPKNIEVIIGTPVADVLEFCGGTKETPGKVLFGGPMMGVAMPDTSYPVTKVNNAILAFTKQEAVLPLPGPCIRCGRCVEACPVGLSPVEICEAYENKDLDMLDKLSAGICMGCGVCSFVCPAMRYVSQNTAKARAYYIKEAKK